MSWVWLSFATVAVSVALPKLVKVALPVTSPVSVKTGSVVWVVSIDTLPMLVIVPEPVTAPVRVMTGSVVWVVSMDTLPMLVIVPEPVTAPVRVMTGSEICAAVRVTFADPSRDTDPLSTPPRVIVLAVAHLLALTAFALTPSLPSSAAWRPSTLLMMWLWESSAITMAL